MEVNLGHNIFRVKGESGDADRTYEKRWPLNLLKPTLIVLSYDKVEKTGGGFFPSRKRTYKRTAKYYDIYFAQMNALEDGFYRPEDYWKKLAADYRGWVKKGCPSDWKQVEDFKKYALYSPMTWK